MNDFIAVGDIVIDAFIKLKDARVHCDLNDEHCTITMAFGDKIPYESVDVIKAVGNSANAAVSAARLGLSSALVSNLGGDENGKGCLESLKNDGVETKFVTIHEGKKTNYHYVLWYENDRTILIKHEEYNYHLPQINEPKWLYLSSLGDNTLEFHSEIIKWLEEHPNVSLAFQPGTFQMKLGREKLKDVYKIAQIFFCNVEEAERILEVEGLKIEELLKRMHELGPKIIVITDGGNGAYAFDGDEIWFCPPYPDDEPPFERTGAGDAFASTTVVALSLGKNLATALAWGAINARAVVKQIGAQRGLLSRQQLEKYLEDAPFDFKPKKLN